MRSATAIFIAVADESSRLDCYFDADYKYFAQGGKASEVECAGPVSAILHNRERVLGQGD